MLDALSQDYVRVATAKGLPRRTVIRRHVVPNAITPVLTVTGLDFAALFGEAAVIEWIPRSAALIAASAWRLFGVAM
jgi:peptide/nickel transport system permease protein